MAWAESKAEAQRSSCGDTQPLLGHMGPGLRGRGTVDSLDGGAGAGSPWSSLRETHGSTCLLGRAQSTAGRSDCFSNNHIPSQQEGQERGRHTSSLLEGSVEDFHLASV